MNRNRVLTKFAAFSLVCSVTMTSGCDILNWFGPNFTVTNVIPVGLGGSPGLLNPFGIVQALVNSLLGIGTSTPDTTTGSETGAAPSAVPDSGTINTVVTTGQNLHFLPLAQERSRL